MKIDRFLGSVAVVAVLAACNPSTTPRDGGTMPRDGAITLRDGAAPPPDGAVVDGGGPRDGGGPTSCGPQGPGECNVLLDIAIAGGGGGPAACAPGQACRSAVGAGGGDPTLMCVPAGLLMDGADCDSTMSGQCAEGFDCSQFDMKCRRLCCGNTDCAAGTQFCQSFTNTTVGICRTRGDCSILMDPQTDCGVGQGCYHVGMGEGACSPAGTVALGAECGGAAGQCVPGAGCFGAAGGTFLCRDWCDPAAVMPCATGFTCAMFAEEGSPTPVPGLGYCSPNP